MVRVTRGFFVIGPGLCLLAATAGCYPQDIAAPQKIPPRTVEVIEVRAQLVADAETLIGRIEPWREATLYFEVPGVVAEVFVEEGDAVDVGDPIAKLELEDYRLAVSRAQANLDAATAQLDVLLAGTREEDIAAAKAEHARAKAHEEFWTAEALRIEELSKTGAASNLELRKAQRDLQAAIEEARSAKAALDRAVTGPRSEDIEAAKAEARARQQALAQANRQLEKVVLKAPFRGTVERRFVDPGAYVNVTPSGGVPIVHLVDIATVDAVISVPEAGLVLWSGQTEVEIRSATDAGISAIGRVEAIGNVADRAAGTYELRVRFDNANKRFRGGMVVTATNPSAPQRNAIRIPLTALRRPYGQSPAVLLVSPQDNQVISRPVELGPVRDNEVEIVRGLAAGELLIVGGQHLVVEGDVVKYWKLDATAENQNDDTMKLPELSVRFPSLMTVTVVIAIAWGAVSLVTLPREEDPVLTWRLANVVTRLPGASPERVESLITDVLERHIEQVDEVEHIYSVSRAGVSLLQVELSDGVTAADPVWQKVRHKLAVATSELPPGIVGPELDDEIMGTFAALIAVTAPGRSYRELKDTAQALEDRLRYLPMTASTDLFGTQQEVIQVEPDPAKLAAYGLSFDEIAATLAHRNTRRPSGRLQVAGGELLIEASGEFEAEDEVTGMILMSTPDGSTLRVGDVAGVRRTTAQPPEPLARINGQPAVVVGARARRGVRIDVYGQQVKQIVRQFSQSLPADVRCTVAHDLAHYTTELTEQLSGTLLMSVALVFLSTAVFMGWRAAGIITVAIPLTGLIALVCFSLIGIPLNQMSVMAMIMSMGLLVDDAIVVTEQIHRRVGEGIDVKLAAADEPSRLSLPLLVTTLTTLAAFLPIYLLPGGTGEFVRAIPVTITVCLLAALVVAVAVIPWLASQFLKIRSRRTGLRSRLSRLTAPVTAGYTALLKGSVRRPLVTVVVIVAAMGTVASLGLALRRDFFSPVQRDQFVVDVFAPQGSSLEHTADVVRHVDQVLADEPQITSRLAFIGRNAPLVFYNLTSQETYANHYAQLIVRVSDWRQTAAVAQRVQTALRANVAGADVCAHILEHGAPLVAPFEIRIRGATIETLHALGRRIEALLHDTPGVRNVRNNYGNEALKLVAQVNEPVARSIGVDQDTVAQELRSRLDGLPAGDVQEGDERIDIAVRLPTADRDDVTDLRAVYFKPTPDTRLIPLATVAALEPAWEASSIYRRDGQRTLSVLAYPQFGMTAAQVSRRFLPRLAALAATLPPGYEIELGGENEQRTEAEGNLLRKAIYAVGLVLLMLLVEFRSMRLTGLIVTVIPLSLAGTMLGLWLTGWPLNFMAIMGMMILIGVMVNDAIILIDGFERRSRAGQPIEQAVVEGTLERTRHVVITSVTTIAGFLPLALSPSLLWPPLAIAIIGGLALSTLLTLVALPAAYRLVAAPQRPLAGFDPHAQ